MYSGRPYTPLRSSSSGHAEPAIIRNHIINHHHQCPSSSINTSSAPTSAGSFGASSAASYPAASWAGTFHSRSKSASFLSRDTDLQSTSQPVLPTHRIEKNKENIHCDSTSLNPIADSRRKCPRFRCRTDRIYASCSGAGWYALKFSPGR